MTTVPGMMPCHRQCFVFWKGLPGQVRAMEFGDLFLNDFGPTERRSLGVCLVSPRMRQDIDWRPQNGLWTTWTALRRL